MSAIDELVTFDVSPGLYWPAWETIAFGGVTVLMSMLLVVTIHCRSGLLATVVRSCELAG